MEEIPRCPCCGSESLLLPERQQWGNCMVKGWVIICTHCSCGACNLNKEALLDDWKQRAST